MIILSMDLSLSCSAFAVIEKKERGKPKVLHLSHCKTNPKQTHGERLNIIYKHLNNIYEEFSGKIDIVVSEKGFSRHAHTTQVLFMVHGIAKLCGYVNGYEVEEVTPTTVKARVSGNGKASKEEVAEAVQNYFTDKLVFKTNDESDAVAVGLAALIFLKKLKQVKAGM